MVVSSPFIDYIILPQNPLIVPSSEDKIKDSVFPAESILCYVAY